MCEEGVSLLWEARRWSSSGGGGISSAHTAATTPPPAEDPVLTEFRNQLLAPARVFGQAFDDGELPFEGDRAACWHRHAAVGGMHSFPGVWHTGRQENAMKEGRKPFGTLVTGPAGSGKTVFMAYEVADALPRKDGMTTLTALMKLASILSKYDARWDASCETAAARAKRARELLPGAVVAELRRLLQPYRLALDTYVAVCIDEVEAVPGVMAEELVWYDIAREVVQHAAFDGDVTGVHVVAAGVGAQGPADYYRSFPPIAKVRLRPWGEAEVLRMIKLNCAGGPSLEECITLLYLTQAHPLLPQPLLAAMTNPRMACGVVQRLYEEATSPAYGRWLGRVFAMRGELVKAAVCAHVERSALQPLMVGADGSAPSTTKELRSRVARGVGVGALRAVMNQNAYDALNLQPLTDPTDVACARAAEAFGLIESNISNNGGRGRLAYEISDAMVLVALHLAGVDVSELAAGAASEEGGLVALAALAESVAAAGEHHLDTVSAKRLSQESALPAALATFPVPVVREPLPRCLNLKGVWRHWGTWTMWPDKKEWSVPPPKEELRAIVPSWTTAPLPAVLGHRRLYQCVVMAAVSQPQPTQTPVGIVKELKKSGLLTTLAAEEDAGEERDDPAMQRAVLEVMLSRWAATEERWLGAAEKRSRSLARGGRRRKVRAAELRRSANDFVPHRQTVGSRRLYPLCLLLEKPSAAAAEWTKRQRKALHPSGSAANASTLPWHAVVSGRRRPPTRHSRWCEFRFVVNDPSTMATNSSPTLAVFERSGIDAPWEVAYMVEPPPGTADQDAGALSLLRERLRVDVDLTLIAVTMTDAVDAVPGTTKRAWP